jgi:hypothetical protein
MIEEEHSLKLYSVLQVRRYQVYSTAKNKSKWKVDLNLPAKFATLRRVF